MEDNKIVDLYWERSETAIKETANRFGPYCFKIAKNILWDLEDSEECVNDTYLTAWAVIPPQRPNKLSAFLAKITRNLAINRLKERNALKRGAGEFQASLDELIPFIPDSNGLEEELDINFLTAGINRFLKSQSKEARSLFVCRYFYCDSIEDIAQQFGCSQSKVKSNLFRTRKRLKDFLEKEGIFL